MARTANVLRRIQGRPLSERRVLGGLTYAAAAAVVIALWVGSLRATLTASVPAAVDAAAELAPSVSGETTQDAARTDKPPTPLKALGESIRDAIAGFHNVKLAFNNEAAQPAAAPDGALSNISGQMPPPAPLQKNQEAGKNTLSQNAGTAVKTPAPSELAGSVINAAGSAPYSTYDLARLIAVAPKPAAGVPPAAGANAAPPAPDTTPSGAYSVLGIIADNLGELRRTVADIYTYFTH